MTIAVDLETLKLHASRMDELSVSDMIQVVSRMSTFGRRNLVHALATTDAVEHMQVASDLAQAEGRADLERYRDARDVAEIERLNAALAQCHAYGQQLEARLMAMGV
jgi:hypothetical protein